MAANRHAVTAMLIVCIVLPTGLMLLATLLGLRGSAAFTFLGVWLVATAVAVLVQLVAAVKALVQDRPFLALTLLVAAPASVAVPIELALSQSHSIGMWAFYPL